MEAFLQERPELNTHVTGLKEDIADLIKVLSEKLTNDSDAEAAIDEEVSSFAHKGAPQGWYACWLTFNLN